MNADFLDFIRALSDAEVRFIIVGAYAVNIYVDPRATGDLDIWVEASRHNAERVFHALKVFGAPLDEISESDFTSPGITFQIGLPPRRIDILSEITGVEFEEAWQDREMRPFGTFTIAFLGRKSLIKNKRATGRPKDLADLDFLENS
jgi:hypothetical protein